MKFDSIPFLSAAKKYIVEFWSQGLLGISIVIFLIRVVMPSSGYITYGFGAYYTASRLFIEGRAGPILYDDHAFRAEVERDTNNKASDIYWANPPTTALLFLPLAFLSAESARILWIGFSVLCLILAAFLLERSLVGSSLHRRTFYLVSSGFLLSTPLAGNFHDGQAYVFLLALYSLALLALRARVDWAAGFSLALALGLKGSGLPLLLLLAIQGRWRLIGWVSVGFIGLAIASLPWLGISPWQEYILHVIPRFLVDPVIAVTAYQTVPGFLRHLFTYDELWNPGPLANWPTFSLIAAWLITGTLLGVAAARSKRASLEWVFCIGLLLSVILVPAAEGHHYVLLFPAVLFAALFPGRPRALFLIAAALIAIPLAYTSREFSQGWLSLIAYPRLYGAIILYILLLGIPNGSKPNPLTPGR